ncbi:Hypothetical protein CINCED_3A006888, partial [Cinara cedri]
MSKINEQHVCIKFCLKLVAPLLSSGLDVSRVAAKFVPQLLTSEQKENRLTNCQDLKNRSADINFIKNIISEDEKWVYGYDPETKLQSSQWKTKFSLDQKKLA